MSTRTIPAATRQGRRALGAYRYWGPSLALAQTPNPSFALVGGTSSASASMRRRNRAGFGRDDGARHSGDPAAQPAGHHAGPVPDAARPVSRPGGWRGAGQQRPGAGRPGAAACAVRGRTARQRRQQPIHRRCRAHHAGRAACGQRLCAGHRRRQRRTAGRRTGRRQWGARAPERPKGIYGQANGAGAKPRCRWTALQPRPGQLAGACAHRFSGLRCARCGRRCCPAGNRPADPNARRYTCGAVSAEALAPALAGCDPPAGALARGRPRGLCRRAGARSGRRLRGRRARSWEAEVGIYTSPGAEPVYVFIEEALMGTVGQPFVGVPQEASRVRIVGFTTDPSRAVEVQPDRQRAQRDGHVADRPSRADTVRRGAVPGAFCTPGRPRTTRARCGATCAFARRCSAARTRSWPRA